MLIVPVENRPDWRNPPLATLLLIVINVLVFFVYQGKDPERLAKSYELYAQSGLMERERQPFIEHLKQADRTLLPRFEAHPDDPRTPPQLAAWQQRMQFEYAAHDPAFARALHQRLDDDPAWRADRSRFDALLQTVSGRAYAFHVREARPVTWVSNLFLHSDAMHLFGNMVFLFLFGFALEIAIGRGVFVLLYLCAGIGGTLLFWATAPGADYSVLGASGAVSGLMGMYIALYGARKISFFYHVIFFTGQLRAPALIMLPVWVAHELWGAWKATENVAYWAHIGGLLFGFVLLALWMRFGLKVDRDYVEKLDADAPFRAAQSRIQKLVVAMRLDAAREAAQALVQAHPRDARAWRGWYDVAKISPTSRDYHLAVHSLFKQSGNAARDPALQTLVEEVAHEYIRIGGDMPALTESASLMLAQRLGRVEHAKPLGVVVGRLLALQSRHEAMPRILQAAGNLAFKAGQTARARDLREQLQACFPDSQEARQLAAHTPA